MLKVLLKKQLMECFRSYFVKQKTGKPRSKKQVIWLFILFGALMGFLALSFGGMASFFGINLLNTSYSWLYYAIMGILAVAFGVFGSVFNTFSSMYLAKDNELLLSMPIPPVKILIARLSLEYILSLLYSGIVFVPSVLFGVIYQAFTGHFPVASLVFGILLIFILSLFIMVITTCLGFVVAILSTRLKKKAFLNVFLILIGLAVYYFFAFRMQYVMNMLIEHTADIAKGIQSFAYVFYMLGKAADGNVLFFILFTVMTAILTSLLLFVLSKTFYKVILGINKTTKKEGKKCVTIAASSVKSALLKKELKRFTSSTTYMLNCGLSVILLPAAAIFAAVSKGTIISTIQSVDVSFFEAFFTIDVLRLIPILCVTMVNALVGMNLITVPSVSLEGKNLWILQSLPVSGKEVLLAKLKVHVFVNLVPAVLSAVILCVAFKIDVLTSLLILTSIVSFDLSSGILGLVLGLKNPVLNWTNENLPIKQNIMILVVMLINVGEAFFIPMLYVVMMPFIPPFVFLLFLTMVYTGEYFLLRQWLVKKGSRIFEVL